jgi:hypothetical protein
LSEKDFINKWIKLLSSEGIKKFPDDFSEIKDYIFIETPKQTLMLGKEFFGAYEVLTTSGESVYQAADMNEAKYIIYSGRNRSGKIQLPLSKDAISSSIKKYEAYVDSVLSGIEIDFKRDFSITVKTFHWFQMKYSKY